MAKAAGKSAPPPPPPAAPLPLGPPPGQERATRLLARLAANPPQGLVLEGGTAAERLAMARHLAALLLCTAGDAPSSPGLPGMEVPAPPRPCETCAACAKLSAQAHRDCLTLSGQGRQIKIDEIRDVRAVLGEPPREGDWRVVILHEAQGLGQEAANALLKSLEEPRPGTVFVLTAPQREHLLPTLVSRSFVLTLTWPQPGASAQDTAAPPAPSDDADTPDSSPEDPADWLAALCRFATHGQGWFERTAAKGRADRLLAERLLVLVERQVLLASRGTPELLQLSPTATRHLGLAVSDAREALNYQVRPALVLDWLAVTARGLVRE